MNNTKSNTLQQSIVAPTKERNVNEDTPIEMKQFDKTKSADASHAEKILIDSNVANVNIFASDTSKVTAHFHGKAAFDGDILFNICAEEEEIKIVLRFLCNKENDGIKLDVAIPSKTYEAISVETSAANVVFRDSVNAYLIKAQTQSGKVQSDATFANMSVTTMSGDVEVYARAEKEISVGVTTMSGDVSAEFYNVKRVQLCASSISGKIKKTHTPTKEGYKAFVYISTMSGDILVK